MPTHRLCSQVEWTLRMESCRQGHHGPCWAPVSLRRPGYEGTPKIWHIEAAHQMLVKRNEGGRLLKATVLCGGTILFYFSWLKIENFKNKKFQNVNIYIMSPYLPLQRIIFSLIPSDIFLLHFLSYHVLDHILVVLIIFPLCFDYTIFLWFVSDKSVWL